LLDLKRMEHERVQEAQQVQQLNADNAILERHADSLATDRSALERLARERYGMIGPGERLYRFVDTLDATPADTSH
jgi:cell division protein FtsB